MIDPNRVEALLNECLCDAGSGDVIKAVLHDYEVDRSRAQGHRAEIVGMLDQLPDQFMDNGGGGWSFLNLCEDKDGRLWTGLHWTCEKLCVLADALGLLIYPFPREVWSALPGNLPYVQFKRSSFAEAAPQ